MSQSIVIIGAGPAGLTAAYELLKKGQVSVTILEATGEIGGISRTKNYKGNRMDIGGHRFFSKSDKAMDFWKEIMPLEDRGKGNQPRSGRSAVFNPPSAFPDFISQEIF